MRVYSLLFAGILMLGSHTVAIADDAVKATLTGIDCSGDYCQLQYSVNNKPQHGICGDEVYCEQWAEQEKFPASALNKLVTLQVKREKLDGQNAEANVVSKINF